MKKIFFATSNENKIREASEILKIDINPLKLEVDEVQTLDPLVCVERKAESAYEKAQVPLLVEDTSLFFAAWEKLPGVFIDYFMKSMGIEGILRLMNGEKNRRVVAQTALCFFDGKNKVTVAGTIRGSLARKARGQNGFGWDSIFTPQKQKKTFAEMTVEEKNKISMRRKALEKLRKELSLF